MTAAPDRMKGIVLYNLACFYATHGQVQKAAGTLPEALRLAPHLQEWSWSDPDLAALRPQPVAPFYSGWEGYQQRMVQALAPLSSEQLAWSAVPHLRSVGLIARHVVGACARHSHSGRHLRISARYPLERAADALHDVINRKVMGKVVLIPA